MAKRQVNQRRKLEKKQLEQHGRNFCEICRKTVTPAKNPWDSKRHNLLTVDHILPKSKGGKDSLDNLRIACNDCNVRKGNELDDSFLMRTTFKINIITDKLLLLENSL